jgi:hypothetical protein
MSVVFLAGEARRGLTQKRESSHSRNSLQIFDHDGGNLIVWDFSWANNEEESGMKGGKRGTEQVSLSLGRGSGLKGDYFSCIIIKL